MDRLTAEAYARRCAEDELRTGHDEDEAPHGLQERIRALVFVGLLSSEAAVAILSGYGRARALRGLGGYLNGPYDDGSAASEVARLCRCSGEIEVSGATIEPRLVKLSAQRTRLAATIRFGSGGGPRPGRHQPRPFIDMHEIALRDDKGGSVSAHLSGGGGASEWRGWYEAEPGLSPDTTWIEVEGTRVTLDDTVAPATVTVETYADADLTIAERATRYLEHCARTETADHESSVPAIAAETLVACGALAADSPAAAAALGAGPPGTARPAVFPGTGGPRFPPPSARGRRPRRPAGTVIVGVTTPPVDGVSITVTDLETASDGFRVDIDGAGALAFGGHAGGIGDPRLAFRATDDLGTHYGGSVSDFEHGSEGFSGAIEFWPALDPDASFVDLEFSTERGRAIVHVPLQWGDRS